MPNLVFHNVRVGFNLQLQGFGHVEGPYAVARFPVARHVGGAVQGKRAVRNKNRHVVFGERVRGDQHRMVTTEVRKPQVAALKRAFGQLLDARIARQQQAAGHACFREAVLA